MLSVETITPIPEVRELITELDPVLSSTEYYLPLPHHSYAHSRDDVLPVALRLDGLEVVKSPVEETLELAAGSLVHDIRSWVALDPQEGFKTKEERTAAIIRDLLPSYGFKDQRLTNVCDLVISTTPGAVCETPNQVKLRRGDVDNVASESRPVFLATTVNLFHEEIITHAEAKTKHPAWPKFISVQQEALFLLLGQDLSVSSEIGTPDEGRFNRDAMRNAKWLSKCAVTNPHRFVSTYRRHFKSLVPAFAEIEPYIIG